MTSPTTAVKRRTGNDATQFLSRLGERVRQVRRDRGISRRVLSERSGISLRYLAQLEAGTGNMSVALLYRVAVALDCPAGGLLEGAESDAKPAGPEKQGIALVGLRGAGKSTLGAQLAEHSGYKFVELNDMIESESGMPVAEVIALYGEDGYRELERRALETAIAEPAPLVLAAGGGIVSKAETFDRLLSSFHTVWLKASPGEHMQRVRDQGDLRPMAGNPDAMGQLKFILESREKEYARATAVVDTAGLQVEESLERLIAVADHLAVSSGS